MHTTTFLLPNLLSTKYYNISFFGGDTHIQNHDVTVVLQKRYGKEGNDHIEVRNLPNSCISCTSSAF